MLNEKIKQWRIVVFCLGVVLLIGVLGIFTLYSMSLGGVSRNAEDWGSFGSLLSGVFTLVTAIAASAAFLVTRMQFDRLVEHQEEQERVLVFDRYVKHLDLFRKKCDEIERGSENRFEIISSWQLYQRLFPKNSPTRCQYTPDGTAHEDLLDFWDRLKKIDVQMFSLESSDSFYGLIYNIIYLAEKWGVNFKKMPQVSLLKDKNNSDLIIDLYDVCESYNLLHDLFLEICLFVGINSIDYERPLPKRELLVAHLFRESLLKENSYGLKFIDCFDSLKYMHSMYSWLGRGFNTLEGNETSIKIKQNLESAFRNSQSIRSYIASNQASEDLDRLLRLGAPDIAQYALALDADKAALSGNVLFT